MSDRNTSLLNGDRARGLFEGFLSRMKNRSTADELGMNIASDEENAAAAESDLTIRYGQTISSLATDSANYAAPEEHPEFFGTAFDPGSSMAEASTADAADVYAEDIAILEFSSEELSNCGEEWAAAKGKRTSPSDLMQHTSRVSATALIRGRRNKCSCKATSKCASLKNGSPLARCTTILRRSHRGWRA